MSKYRIIECGSGEVRVQERRSFLFWEWWGWVYGYDWPWDAGSVANAKKWIRERETPDRIIEEL
jgi:hypothetical protein